MEKARLDKIIAAGGRYSRREVRQLIRQGRVLADGVPARAPEDKVDPESAEILVNGERLCYRRFTWLMLQMCIRDRASYKSTSPALQFGLNTLKNKTTDLPSPQKRGCLLYTSRCV